MPRNYSKSSVKNTRRGQKVVMKSGSTKSIRETVADIENARLKADPLYHSKRAEQRGKTRRAVAYGGAASAAASNSSSAAAQAAALSRGGSPSPKDEENPNPSPTPKPGVDPWAV